MGEDWVAAATSEGFVAVETQERWVFSEGGLVLYGAHFSQNVASYEEAPGMESNDA